MEPNLGNYKMDQAQVKSPRKVYRLWTWTGPEKIGEQHLGFKQIV